ncbi:MAG: hypothetical protein ACEQSK_14805 [Sphingomonadaceae bacterium]
MDHEFIPEIACHDELLDIWEAKFHANNLPFERDGILSPEQWNSAPLKVLVVLKETNRPQPAHPVSRSVVEEISRALNNPNSRWWRKNVLRRVGRWAFGLTTYAGEVPSYRLARIFGNQALPSIAYMNMKKSSGGANTNQNSFAAHVKEYAPYIRRQIELIKPDVVVLGGTFQAVKHHVFPELERVGERAHCFNGVLFINAFHPAQRTISAEELYRQVVDSFHKYKSSYAASA